jgi:hypothetical protein
MLYSMIRCVTNFKSSCLVWILVLEDFLDISLARSFFLKHIVVFFQNVLEVNRWNIIVFVISVGMNTSCLSKYIVYDRFVCRILSSKVSTNLLTVYNEDSFTLIAISGMKSLITATVLSRGAFQRSPIPFTVTCNPWIPAFKASNISNTQIIVVMRMKIKMDVWISLYNFRNKFKVSRRESKLLKCLVIRLF